jgi:transcriptional regulator with XRE-family HTH domain
MAKAPPKTRTTRRSPLDHEPEAVAYAREKAGLNRAQLAERVGCAPSLITEIEGGTRNANPAMLLRLAEALNCPVVVLERKRPSAGAA